MSKKIEVDKGLCIGCGSCVSSCSECFEFGNDGKAQVKEVADDRCCDLESIADSCPVQAITVREI